MQRPRVSRAACTSEPTNAARSRSSSHAMNASSNWSTASTTRAWSLTAAPARLSSSSGCSPGRITTCSQSLAARQYAARQRGEQPRPQGRRLAASRRPDDAEQRGADEPRDERRDEPLAAEVVLGVVDVERGEALERADHRPVPGANLGRTLARRLKILHAAGELGLHRAQPDASSGCLLGHRLHAPARLEPRPVARDLVHAGGHPAALLEHRLRGQVGRRAPGRVDGDDRRHRLDVERLQRQRRTAVRARKGGVVARAGNHEHGKPGEGCRKLLEFGAKVGGQAVGVVDDRQQRVGRLTGAGERSRGPWRAGRRRSRTAQRRHGGGPRRPARPRGGSCRSRARR